MGLPRGGRVLGLAQGGKRECRSTFTTSVKASGTTALELLKVSLYRGCSCRQKKKHKGTNLAYVESISEGTASCSWTRGSLPQVKGLVQGLWNRISKRGSTFINFQTLPGGVKARGRERKTLVFGYLLGGLGVQRRHPGMGF